MNQAQDGASADSEFTFDPTNKVVGIVDEPGDAIAALRDLRAAGFTADEIEVLMGEDGARRIDMSGEWQEVLVHIVAATQKPPAYYDAPVIVRRVQEATLAGHYFIGIAAKESEAREGALNILRSHGGHFINFYGQWAAEALEP